MNYSSSRSRSTKLMWIVYSIGTIIVTFSVYYLVEFKNRNTLEKAVLVYRHNIRIDIGRPLTFTWNTNDIATAAVLSAEEIGLGRLSMVSEGWNSNLSHFSNSWNREGILSNASEILHTSLSPNAQYMVSYLGYHCLSNRVLYDARSQSVIIQPVLNDWGNLAKVQWLEDSTGWWELYSDNQMLNCVLCKTDGGVVRESRLTVSKLSQLWPVLLAESNVLFFAAIPNPILNGGSKVSSSVMELYSADLNAETNRITKYELAFRIRDPSLVIARGSNRRYALLEIVSGGLGPELQIKRRFPFLHSTERVQLDYCLFDSQRMVLFEVRRMPEEARDARICEIWMHPERPLAIIRNELQRFQFVEILAPQDL